MAKMKKKAVLHNFEDIPAVKAIRNDPKRAANVQREKRKAVMEIIAYNLAELRKHQDLTQTDIAEAIGSHQPTISQLENGDDLLLSTLRAYVEALGGTLHAYVEIDGEEFPLAV